MGSGIRAMQLVNFKGDKYLTETEVDKKIEEAIHGGGGIIDDSTGNLREDLNPTKILSMENPDGFEDSSSENWHIDEDYRKLKFIGNCKVNYKGDGAIEIRIGDNLNCSLYNGTDGISTTTVSSAKSGDSAGTLSDDYTAVSALGEKRIFQSGDTITANCGSNPSTADGPTDGTNGNEVHFNDNKNGKFKVYIKESKNAEATVYTVGPITANGTYKAKDSGNNEVAGISCVITNFGEEPKKAKGATGYSGNVNFTLTPASIFADSEDFQFVKIEMIEGTSVAATWNNASTNGVYFYMKETTKPGTPSGADYTLTAVTLQESGVTYLTKSSTVKPNASGMSNVGYPAYVENKAYCAPNASNAWFTAFNDESTGSFTTWTTAKDATMSWEYGSAASLKEGVFANPQVVVNGVNYNGSGSTATSSKTDNKLWVHAGKTSGSNITDNRWKSDFTAKQDYASIDLTTDATALQVYQGLLQYPSTDYSSYNKASATNPDYSSCDGDRYYYMKFSKAGSMPNGQINVASVGNITNDLANGNVQFQIAKDQNMSKLYNIVFSYNGDNNIGGSNSVYGTASQLKYTFSDGAANDYIWLRITMKKGCTAQIKSALLDGGSLA